MVSYPETLNDPTTDNACKLQTNSSKFSVDSCDICYQRRLLYTTKGENEQRSQSNLLKFLM